MQLKAKISEFEPPPIPQMNTNPLQKTNGTIMVVISKSIPAKEDCEEDVPDFDDSISSDKNKIPLEKCEHPNPFIK